MCSRPAHSTEIFGLLPFFFHFKSCCKKKKIQIILKYRGNTLIFVCKSTSLLQPCVIPAAVPFYGIRRHATELRPASQSETEAGPEERHVSRESGVESSRDPCRESDKLTNR